MDDQYKKMRENIRREIEAMLERLPALWDQYLAASEKAGYLEAAFQEHTGHHPALAINAPGFKQQLPALPDSVLSLDAYLDIAVARRFYEVKRDTLKQQWQAARQELSQLEDEIKKSMPEGVWFQYGELGFGVYRDWNPPTWKLMVTAWADEMPSLGPKRKLGGQ